MKAIITGSMHLRPELRDRLRGDIEAKHWLTASKGTVLKGRTKEDAQNRIIYILDVPP